MAARPDRELAATDVRLIHARPAAREGPPHAHAEAMLFVPLAGALRFTLDGERPGGPPREWVADARAALLVRGGVRHAHRAVHRAALLEYLVVYVDDARLARHLRARGVPASDRAAAGAWAVPNTPLLRELSGELLAELARPAAGAGARDAAALDAAVTLLCALAARARSDASDARSALVRDPDAPPPDDPRLARALSLARARFRQGVSPRELARAAGMSQRAFERALLAATGLSPRRLIEQMRLAEARARLATGREAVTAVAIDLGYRSLSHFVRRFRAVYGAPPTSFVPRRGGPVLG